MQNVHLNGKGAEHKDIANLLAHLKEIVVETNREWAGRLGIPASAAVTCVKPEGTASQLVGGPSGISPEYARFYLRRVRQDRKDPLTNLMIDEGIPHEDDVMNKENEIGRAHV